MNKLEKIKSTSYEVSEIPKEETLEGHEEEKSEEKIKKKFSFFSFWKKMTEEESEEGEILEDIQDEREKVGTVVKFLNKKATVLAACVLVIAIAGYINIRFSNPGENIVSVPNDNALDMGTLDSGAVLSDSVEEDTSVATNEDYFALAVINRERVRDEAIEMLKTVADSDSTDVSAKNEAYAEMTRMAEEIANEANIESLVKAKGFAECVTVISGDGANIIVETDGLSINEVAQIKEIVYLECGVIPDNIKIIEKANV